MIRDSSEICYCPFNDKIVLQYRKIESKYTDIGNLPNKKNGVVVGGFAMPEKT